MQKKPFYRSWEKEWVCLTGITNLGLENSKWTPIPHPFEIYLSSFFFWLLRNKKAHTASVIPTVQSHCHLVAAGRLRLKRRGKFRIFTFIKICTYLDTLLIPIATCWLRDTIIFSFFLICIWFSCHRNVTVFSCLL